MVITTVVDDEVLLLRTKELLIVLSYESAEFTMKMDKSTFYSGVDSLDQQLELMKFEIIEVDGKFDLDFINTEHHPPLDFNVDGIVSTTGKTLRGTGRLEHISDGSLFSCLLTMKFNVTMDQLGFEVDGLEVKDEIQIEIAQTLLEPIGQ